MMASVLSLPQSSLTFQSYSPSYKSLFGTRDDLDQESIRKQTFIFWPAWVSKTVSTAHLARIGFCYTGNADNVMCFCCKIVIGGWTEGADAIQLHLTRSPECRFLKELLGNEVDYDDDDDDLEIDGEGEDFVDFGRNGEDNFLSDTRERMANDRGKIFQDGTSVRVGDEQDCVDGSSIMLSSVGTRVGEQLRPARLTSETSLPLSSTAVDSLQVRMPNTPELPEEANIDVSRYKSDNSSSSSPLGNDDDTPLETRKDASSAADKTKLKMENEKLRKAMMCRKCKNEKIQTLFLPCRHLVTCEACAAVMDNCIECDKQILGTVRTFMV